jgi:transcriptional regulator with XRE-family HTH domain
MRELLKMREMSRIEGWRLLHDLGRDKAGVLLGISESYVRLIERGHALPGPVVKKRIEDYFGEPFERLVQPLKLRDIPRARPVSTSEPAPTPEPVAARGR